MSTLVLMALYLATSAPDLTFWDAAELTTAAHTLGIPHPPATPLWVLLGNLASKLFSASGPARSVTILSVIASALVGGAGALLTARWIGARGAVVAAVSAGAMMSVWSNATETEVYAVALLASALMLVAGERAGRHDVSDAQRDRWRALIVFLAAISVPLHLSVLVALPAAVVLGWRGQRPTTRALLAWSALALLGLSAVAVLPYLAGRDPALNSGNPSTVGALIDVLQRKQYAVAGLWPRRAPLWLQLGNVFEWADWQVAFGLHPEPAPSFARTTLSVLWVWLGALGLRALFRHEARVGRAMTVLLLSGTFGVALWLNLRAGPSYGQPLLPVGALHEARERDYFFVLGFWAWGLCAGAGMTAMTRALARRLPAPIALLPLALAAVPVLANRPVMDRTREPAATLPRTIGRLLLSSVPPNAVLYVAGDNDAFPLWYLQQVESMRSDVLVVTVPLLGAPWYRHELARRHRLLPSSSVGSWPGMNQVLAQTAGAARRSFRPIRVSVALTSAERIALDPSTGWVLEGLVWAPNSTVAAGASGLDLAAMRRQAEQVPPSAFLPIVGADPVYGQMQALLRCALVTGLADTLLVGTCNGG
ncbi:MAG: DUF2723 domain-containing protein [Gemmatimonadaceae bacterium]|nr:DUF2723 domain-containing protein [Gemmatimonadaceae bacterium]